MEKDYLKFIRQFLGDSAEMKPVPTDLKPLVRNDPSIRAVVFDIYGTILISASGDIDEFEISAENLKTAFIAGGIQVHPKIMDEQSFLMEILDSFKESIRNFHQVERNEDRPYPEIDILHIWEEILNRNHLKGLIKFDNPLCVKCFTFVFEVLSNKIFPMPGLHEVVQKLNQMKMPMGIISNAQFYTPVILNYFLHNKIAETDRVEPFDPDLTVFSYQYLRSKPDPYLFEMLKEQCRLKYDIYADEILFIGNDMYRDVYPAYVAGFKTALFAGDIKSLRLRPDKPEIRSITPDFVLTDLTQLFNIVN